MGKWVLTLMAMCALAMAVTAQTPAQSPAQAPPQTRPATPARGGGSIFDDEFPQREKADQATVDRGKALYGVQCNFCHGSEARGGEGGPNLLRSDLVLNDKNGESIAQVVQNGRGEMPPINLTNQQVSDIAAYIHSFRVGGYDISRMTPPSILVGDAAAGEKAFQSRCAGCHSPTGDLKGIASKYSNPKRLQNTFLMPRGGTPITVTVTITGGQKVEGRLIRIDDFTVTLADANGFQRTIRRDGDTPKVELHDPLKPHRDMLPTYSDTEIHNITSYLVTLK
jgi:mono/diheme cytochrome c family protein